MFISPRKQEVPPTIYRVRIEGKVNDVLKKYADYYKTNLGTEIKIDDLCALMIESVLEKDRDFKKFLKDKEPPTKNKAS